jgi:hypothetical protein
MHMVSRDPSSETIKEVTLQRYSIKKMFQTHFAKSNR